MTAQAPQQPHQQPNSPALDSGAIGRLTEAQRRTWSIGVVAQTVEGDVVLRMTDVQAAGLRDVLVWVTGGGDE